MHLWATRTQMMRRSGLANTLGQGLVTTIKAPDSGPLVLRGRARRHRHHFKRELEWVTYPLGRRAGRRFQLPHRVIAVPGDLRFTARGLLRLQECGINADCQLDPLAADRLTRTGLRCQVTRVGQVRLWAVNS